MKFSFHNFVKKIPDGSGSTFLRGDYDTLVILIGKPIPGLNSKQMDAIRLISVQYVHKIYIRNLRLKEGVG